MTAPKHGSLTGFLTTISKGGGMSFTNNFEVKFVFPSSSEPAFKINQAGINMNDQTVGNGKNGAAFTMYCEEASLPGVQAQVANTSGKNLGEGAWNYPTQRMYQDISLTWMCDANMMPLKVLQAWMETIFVDNPENEEGILRSEYQLTTAATKASNTITRLNYFNDYKCSFIEIKKGERNATSTIGRTALTYKLYDAYPYSIESSPLSYGSSQIVKVTGNFYYTRWSVHQTPQ